jgi:U3 small nucleolar RNA-associated protein 13
MATAFDLAPPQSVEAAVLLPEEPAPALGVKNSGLHFLTAGDQGI